MRRGWCFGEEQFRMEFLEQVSEKLGTHHGGSERTESSEAKAQSIVRGGNGPTRLERG